jgi:hypothetical protein
MIDLDEQQVLPAGERLMLERLAADVEGASLDVEEATRALSAAMAKRESAKSTHLALRGSLERLAAIAWSRHNGSKGPE